MLIGERKEASSAVKLRALIERHEGLGALNALWALYQITRFESEPETIKKALKHPYAPVRMWTVRLLGDEYGLHRGLGAGAHGRASDGVLWIPLYEALAAQARVETDQPMGRSLMPDGLLEGMSEQELRDLFAYLRISQPITN